MVVGTMHRWYPHEVIGRRQEEISTTTMGGGDKLERRVDISLNQKGNSQEEGGTLIDNKRRVPHH
jgi:hypothetical protein